MALFLSREKRDEDMHEDMKTQQLRNENGSLFAVVAASSSSSSSSSSSFLHVLPNFIWPFSRPYCLKSI
jgi:hypothetical protein